MKNRSIIHFVLHQVIYLLWLFILNELVMISSNLFILAAISLVFLGIFVLSLSILNKRDENQSLSLRAFFKQASAYVVLSAVVLTFLQIITKGLGVLNQSALPADLVFSQPLTAYLLPLRSFYCY